MCKPQGFPGFAIASNRKIDEGFMDLLGSLPVGVVVGPEFTKEALGSQEHCVLKGSKDLDRDPLQIQQVAGGLLIQTTDPLDEGEWRTLSKIPPTKEESQAMMFAWHVAQRAKPNTVVFAKGTTTLGIGAGQASQIDAVNLAVMKAGEQANGAVMASNGPLLGLEELEVAAEAGILACAQPAGRNDGEILRRADDLDMAAIFIGTP